MEWIAVISKVFKWNTFWLEPLRTCVLMCITGTEHPFILFDPAVKSIQQITIIFIRSCAYIDQHLIFSCLSVHLALNPSICQSIHPSILKYNSYSFSLYNCVNKTLLLDCWKESSFIILRWGGRLIVDCLRNHFWWTVSALPPTIAVGLIYHCIDYMSNYTTSEGPHS